MCSALLYLNNRITQSETSESGDPALNHHTRFCKYSFNDFFKGPGVNIIRL